MLSSIFAGRNGADLRKAFSAKTFFCSLLLIMIFPAAIFCQEKYPSKPLSYFIGYAAGGTTDVSTRPLVSAASKILGQPILIVNKGGGASSVAMASLKNEKPDGYSIGTLATGGIISQHLRKVPYDTATDFTPILQYEIYLYGIVVSADSPWKTFKDLIEFAKANPGKVRYSSAGAGTPQHLVLERLCLQEKIKLTHIPFQGGNQAVTALLGNHVEACAEGTDWKKYVEAGRLRLLAVFGESRAANFPNVPTLVELGWNIVAPSIMCVVAPKGVPPQVVKTLHDSFKEAMKDPDFIRTSSLMDNPILYRNSQDLGSHLVKMNEEIGSIVRTLGLQEK